MSSKGRLAILGASGHGKVVADIALQCGWREIGFYDDAYPERSSVALWPVIGSFQTLLGDLDRFEATVVAIGDNRTRDARLEALFRQGASLATLVHPRAVVSPFARLSPGCVVVGGAVINAFATLARGCIVNTASTVDHDCRLANAVHVAPGGHLAGEVSVGAFSWLGVGAVVRQGLCLGEDVMVGAGAVVVSDVADGQTVVGVPARPLSRGRHDGSLTSTPE
ncbi:acetyltransferase [Halomonas sp. 1390]|uniref:acetyltransferase n=1 Tax=Halomonas sp. B23F22_3 TaxID=3459516 RepID=UPI00373F51BC